MIAVDANIVAGFLMPDGASTTFEAVFAKDPDWAAPVLLQSELRNILATLIRRRNINLETSILIMEEAEHLLDGGEFHVASIDVLALAERSGCSAYDCEYVVLAQVLKVPLLTLDRELLAAFPKIAVDPDAFIKSFD